MDSTLKSVIILIWQMNSWNASWMVFVNKLNKLMSLKVSFNCTLLLEELGVACPSWYHKASMTLIKNNKMYPICCFPPPIWRVFQWLLNLTTSCCVTITLFVQAVWFQHLVTSRQLLILINMGVNNQIKI